MTKRPFYSFLLLCFVNFYGTTLKAQASKSIAILETEPVFEPTVPQFAVGGLNFVTLSDGSSVFNSLFYGKIAVIHPNKSSNTPWAKTISFENRDVSPEIKATADGGFLVNMTLTRTITETINKFVLAKFNAQNVLQWAKTIQFDENVTTSVYNYTFSVGADGNILLTGTIKEQNAAAKFYYVFLNADGQRIKSFYFNETHPLVSTCSRIGGGFAAIASIDSTLSERYRFMLFDAQGQLVSSKTYKGDPSFYFYGIKLSQKNNGGFVGVSSSGIVEFDNQGNYVKSAFPGSPSGFGGYSINPPVFVNRDGRFILQGLVVENGFTSTNPAFFMYNDNNYIDVHSLQGESTQGVYISSNDNGGITLSISSVRSSLIAVNPPLKVTQFAINSGFDRTDCGLPILKRTLSSINSDLVRTTLPDLVATNLNPIITTVTNSSLQLTNFNVSHSPLCGRVGVDNVDLEHNITISPNPSSGVFRIKSDAQNADFQRLTVLNNLGQVVTENAKPSWDADLRIEQSGTYIVRIQTNEGVILKKIVKVD
jgi:hypothetical protein